MAVLPLFSLQKGTELQRTRQSKSAACYRCCKPVGNGPWNLPALAAVAQPARNGPGVRASDY